MENLSPMKLQTYFPTAFEAIAHAIEYATSKGYEINARSYETEIIYGGRYQRVRPDEGETRSFTIELERTKKCLHIQLYGMERSYELNAYIN